MKEMDYSITAGNDLGAAATDYSQLNFFSTTGIKVQPNSWNIYFQDGEEYKATLSIPFNELPRLAAMLYELLKNNGFSATLELK